MAPIWKVLMAIAASATAFFAVPVSASAQDAASVPATATEHINSGPSWCENFPAVLQELCDRAPWGT